MEQTRLDLATYMSGSISRIMAKAYKNVLSNPREAKFAFRMQQLFAKSEKRRKKVQEKEGIDVPPFLISSISTTCNLQSALQRLLWAQFNSSVDDHPVTTIRI